jgi:methylmalonyl-CoA mutase
VAGYPKDHIESFTAAGVSDFIHVKSNLLDTLRDFQDRLGVQ